MRFLTFLLIASLLSSGVFSQLPTQGWSSSEIYHRLKKLKVLGSVLYVAAHPDDENTRLIAWLSNHKLYRTGYLSLTRGDGGQNLIGDEQGAELGFIRTQELLAARRIDGGEQFFTRATDFGYSKSPEEAFTMWDHETLLGDAVFIVRYFQPDVVIARFPEDGRAGHGQHSASGIIAREVYDAAADPRRFPEHMSRYGLKPWQVKRVLWNTFNFGGTSNTIDSTQLAVEVGQYDPLLGRSIGELAGEARSQHKSQGFGVSRQRGASREFFTLVKGDKPQGDLMEGVNTTWSRLPKGAAIDAMIDKALSDFNFTNPSAIVPQLLAIRNNIFDLDSSRWRQQKLKEAEQLIQQAAGIYAEATVTNPALVPGDSMLVNLSTIVRSDVPVHWELSGTQGFVKNINLPLEPNKLATRQIKYEVVGGSLETQPYWLKEGSGDAMYRINDLQQLVMAENNPESVSTNLLVNKQALRLNLPLRYRYVDPVKGEQYQPVHKTSPFLVYSNPGIVIFKKGQADSAVLRITVQSTQNDSATVKPGLMLQSDKKLYSKVEMLKPAVITTTEPLQHTLRIPNYLDAKGKESDTLSLAFMAGTNVYFNARRTVVYDHIPNQTWHYVDKVKVLNLDLKTVGKSICYVPGAGDKVKEMLQLMGYSVTTIDAANLPAENLNRFDAIITGVRAYNVYSKEMAGAHSALMRYVQNGGNLIVQYNTSNFISQLNGNIAPYPFSITRNRITEENTPVKFNLPNHPALNYPNKISAQDFANWVQERSIYHADDRQGGKWEYPLAMSDKGEEESKGALAIAPYGKGNFVYTGLVFFRELPAGVAGAFRLIANLIALPKH